MDVVVWLRSLGLGKYEAVFRENDIDETVLLTLTAEDLKELGVTSFGHRRKLLDAIAALRTDASGKTPSVDAATTSSVPSARPEDRAERRQVTVMFSDLVGSTALSARMDPEDLREVISSYQKCVAGTVQRFGGFVAKSCIRLIRRSVADSSVGHCREYDDLHLAGVGQPDRLPSGRGRRNLGRACGDSGHDAARILPRRESKL